MIIHGNYLLSSTENNTLDMHKFIRCIEGPIMDLNRTTIPYLQEAPTLYCNTNAFRFQHSHLYVHAYNNL